MKYKFGFIGAGNMGGALARGISKSAENYSVAVCDLDEKKALALSAETGAAVTGGADIAENAEYIFLGVKPQFLEATLAPLAPVLSARSESFVLVSMAAGTSISKILSLSGGDYPVIRIMPNVPCAVGEGMILACSNEKVGAEEMNFAVSALSNCGRVDVIAEKFIDAFSIVTGCGPAFAYLMIEALADGQVECGVPRDKAYIYAAKMLEGSAKLMLETGKIPAELKDSVCSPGGTTIEGVRALEKGAFRSSVIEAVKASYDKTVSL